MSNIAIVTGGSGGIGKALVKMFHSKGYRVCIHFNSNEAKAKALQEEYPNSFIVKADLSGTPGREHLFNEVKADCNKPKLEGKEKHRIAVLVNNAGVDEPFTVLLKPESNPNKTDLHLEVNYKAARQLSDLFGKEMCKKGGGKMFYISTVLAQYVLEGSVDYAAAKKATECFSMYLGKSVEPSKVKKLQSFSIRCGLVRTPMTEEGIINVPKALNKFLELVPNSRVVEVDEVASLVHFLMDSNENGEVYTLYGDKPQKIVESSEDLNNWNNFIVMENQND